MRLGKIASAKPESKIIHTFEDQCSSYDDSYLLVH